MSVMSYKTRCHTQSAFAVSNYKPSHLEWMDWWVQTFKYSPSFIRFHFNMRGTVITHGSCMTMFENQGLTVLLAAESSLFPLSADPSVTPHNPPRRSIWKWDPQNPGSTHGDKRGSTMWLSLIIWPSLCKVMSTWIKDIDLSVYIGCGQIENADEDLKDYCIDKLTKSISAEDCILVPMDNCLWHFAQSIWIHITLPGVFYVHASILIEPCNLP